MRFAPGFVVAVVAVAFAAISAGCPASEVGPPVGEACSAGIGCADGLVCADGSCVAACTDSSCSSGFCDVASGLCVECVEDVDCGASRVCNSFTNLCTEPAVGCTGDDDCDGGARCDVLKGSCVECLESADCGAGEGCDQLTRTCESQQGCVTDGDCAGSICEPVGRVCVECFTGAHCPSGQCDTVSFTCLSGCDDDDDSEPNEGENAAPLAAGGEHAGAICPDDVDEFVFDADAGSDINAAVTIEGGRLSAELRNDAGTVIATGTTGVSATGVAAGRYRLVIRGLDAAVEADYLVRLTVTAGAGACEELDSEDNDTAATASAIATDGVLRSGSICGDDVDVWSFSVSAGDDVTVSVVPGDGDGVIALEVLQGDTVLASGLAGTDAVVVDAPAGQLLVRVQARGGDVGYSLRVTTSAAPPVCVQRDAEPNDTAEQARPLTEATQNGQICAADVDQWRFTTNALDDVTVTLTGSNVRGRLFNAGGAVIAEGTGTFTATDVDAGVHRIEVKGTSQITEAAYSFTLTVTAEPAADPCAEGGIEPDSRTAPRALSTDGSPASGRVCDGDSDFFRFTVPAGAARLVAVSTKFVDADGDIDVRLLDATGALVVSSTGISDEELIFRSLAAGDYVVEVFGFQTAENTYTTSASIVTCTEDDFEPNNAAAKGVPTAGRALSATRCPQDDDFFAIRLESGDALDARLSGAGLTLSLVSTTGAVLQADVADGADRRLQATALPAGRYALRVTGNGTAGVAYTLTPTITPTPARCVDDGAEPNNSSDVAFGLDGGALADGSYELSTLNMCDGSSDFFAVDVAGNKSVRVFLDHATSADLDVEVLEQRGTTGLYRSLAKGISLAGFLDEVGGVVNAGTRLIIRVAEFSALPAVGLPYTLGLEVGDPPNAPCVDDKFDTFTSTDDRAGARITRRHTNDDDVDPVGTDDIVVAPNDLSPPETLSQLRICPANSDFYKVQVAANQKLNVDVTYVHSDDRDIDIRVFEQGVTAPLACPSLACDGVDGSEHFDVTPTTAKTYFIEVLGFQSSENRYDLRVSN